jgi:uncharacterized protein YdhG (YjbR/CyaY superfamily)
MKPNTVDAYLYGQPEKAVPMLEELRKIIKGAVPEAEEVMSYNMPAYKFHGMLVGFAGWKNHCGFYPWNGHTVKDFEEELEGFTTSSGAIQFPLDQPLPKALIKKIIEARVAENLKKKK